MRILAAAGKAAGETKNDLAIDLFAMGNRRERETADKAERGHMQPSSAATPESLRKRSVEKSSGTADVI
jgi:hypothetical protein